MNSLLLETLTKKNFLVQYILRIRPLNVLLVVKFSLINYFCNDNVICSYCIVNDELQEMICMKKKKQKKKVCSLTIFQIQKLLSMLNVLIFVSTQVLKYLRKMKKLLLLFTSKN